MGGLSAAWRLSEPGWRDRFESITVYQRGWRLGGKGASSRGVHGRIEEHGLHIWLGYYENAFRLLRECYAELDRPRSDPDCPIATWDRALVPTDHLGLADVDQDGGWSTWLGTFTRNEQVPGEDGSDGREMTAVEFLRRAAELLVDFAESLDGAGSDGARPDGARPGGRGEGGLVISASADPPRSADAQQGAVVADGVLPVVTELASLARSLLRGESTPSVPALHALDRLLDATREALGAQDRNGVGRRTWQLASLMAAVVRGIVADELLVDPLGFAAINDEDFGEWILRHGAHPAVLDFALVRGLYDLVFGYRDGDPEQPAFAAGLAVFLTGKTLFEYKGSIFWKMTAGMGDVVFAPLYEALRRRGVAVEFFHRVDALHLDPTGLTVDSVTVGRQVALAAGLDEYEPLVRVRGLPVFPDAPLRSQLQVGARTDAALRELESHAAVRADAEVRELRRGEDYDELVLAVPVGMVGEVAAEVVERRPEWRAMVERLGTVATQAFQVWLRPDEPSLGWPQQGVTVSGYVSPFETWASMPQTLWAEAWPEGDRPGTVAYFCNALDASWPGTGSDLAAFVQGQERRVRDNAVGFLDGPVARFLPGAVDEDGFRWDLLCGADGSSGRAAFDSQYWTANVDPSDRYVQSLPGTDRVRLRSDESGIDGLVLAGDWTDSGLNAGCIEAAVVSGLQAANALLGRSRHHRVRGYYLG